MTWKKNKGEPASGQAEAAAQAGSALSKVKKHLKWIIPLVIVIVLAIAVVQLVLAIAAVAIAGVCLIGSISGG